MRFKDNNINIKIIELQSNANLKFKAFLEKSDITYKILDQELSFAPLDWTSSKVQTRMLQSLDLVFDVYSEDREECIKNYKDLNILINWLKPKYTKTGEMLTPSVQNAFGRIAIDFNGFPRISKTPGPLKILVSTFSYSVNKEMGYIEIPYNGSDEEKKKIYVEGKMKLIPISYKLSIGGQILLSKEDTMIIDDNSTESGGSKTNTDPEAGLPANATAEQREAARGEFKENSESWNAFLSNESNRELFTLYYNTSSKYIQELQGSPKEKMQMVYAIQNLKYWQGQQELKTKNPADYKHVDAQGNQDRKEPEERIGYWIKIIKSGKAPE
jgi:hypothetical protein